MSSEPKFPLTVFYKEDSTQEVFNNKIELACTVEWYDSDNPEEKMKVIDSNGKEVHLKVEGLQILICELKE